MKFSIDQIIKFRQELHRFPELSELEFETQKRIISFFEKLKPDEIVYFEGLTGVAFIFDSKKAGKTTMFRAEIDALPIQEISTLKYKSENKQVMHACGHDGHTAMVAGLAMLINENRPKKGRVVLLFQPAEEVKQGAEKIVNHPKFKLIEPDYIFALHNIPGVEKNKILIKNGSFAAASKGMTIKLFGKTSHAAEPENGISPAMAIAHIIKKLNILKNNKQLFSDLALLTIIHIRLGEIAFGTSPGYAEIMVTLRAFENEDMEILTRNAEKIVQEMAEAEKLKCEITYNEVFPATVNSPECVEIVKKSAQKTNLDLEIIEKPFKWSEDFAYYTQKYQGAFFGVGSGINQPQLHNPNYNFPDDIMEKTIKLFYEIYSNINL